MPGQVVTVVEERLIPGELATSRTSVDGSTWSTSPAHSGEVRARIALDSVALSIDGLTPKGVSAGDGASTFRRRDWAAKPLTPEQLALREQQRLQANRREAEELMARARLALSKGTPDGIELGQRLVKKALKLEDRSSFWSLFVSCSSASSAARSRLEAIIRRCRKPQSSQIRRRPT